MQGGRTRCWNHPARMADSENTTILPDDSDAELLRLGQEYMAMLKRYVEKDWDPRPGSEPFLDAMNDLETRIAAIPAQTVAGMAVRLRVLWTMHANEEGELLGGPKEHRLFADKLVWDILQDAERIAARVG